MTNMRALIRIVESADRDLPKLLYHGTTARRAREIVASGMTPPSYWGSKSIASYYMEVASEDGEDGAIIAVPLSHFDPAALDEDRRSLQEPIPRAISGRFRVALATSDTPWIASFGSVESVIYKKPMLVGAEAVTVIPFAKKDMTPMQRRTFDELEQDERLGSLTDEQRRLLAWMRRTHKRYPWD